MLSETLKHYCKEYVSKNKMKDLDLCLKTSPHYPTLMSIINALNYIGINAKAYKCDIKCLSQITSSFLLHLNNQNVEEVVLAHWNKKTNRIAVYSPHYKKWLLQDIEEIKEKWDGVVIYTEQGERINNMMRTIREYLFESIIFILLVSLFVVVSIFYSSKICLIFVLILVGNTLSICALAKDYGYMNYITEKLCNKSRLFDCISVSRSKYGILWGFRMSELATSFFLSQLIIGLVILTMNNMLIDILWPAIIITLPTTIYSVYSQVKVKHFCTFCIGIISVLLLQSLTIIFVGITFNIKLGVIVFSSTLFIAFVLKKIGDAIESKTKYELDYYDLLTLKRKRYVIEQESIKYSIEYKNAIYLVNSEETTDYVITSVISPSCYNCKRMVKALLEAFDNHIFNFHWRIILGMTHRNDDKLIMKWIECYLNDSQLFYEYLKNWCTSKNRLDFSFLPHLQKQGLIELYQDYFKREILKNKLSGLPRLAINDRLFSSIYDGTELAYLLIDNEITKYNMVPYGER